jgi:hypothetical protein
MKNFLAKVASVLLIIWPLQAMYFVWFPKKEDSVFTQIFITQVIIWIAILAYLFIDWLVNNKK